MDDGKFELIILRKGGVSEKALHEAVEKFGEKVFITAKVHVK
jgi:hypothetical protein